MAAVLLNIVNIYVSADHCNDININYDRWKYLKYLCAGFLYLSHYPSI